MEQEEPTKEKKGLVGLITILMAIVLIFGILSSVQGLLAMVTMAGFGPLAPPLMSIIFGITLNIIILLAAIFLLVLFFKKSKKFPKLFLALLISHDVVMIALVFLSASAFNFTNIAESTLRVLITVAWIISVKKSERVQATFVN